MVTHHPHKWAVVTAIRWAVKPRKNYLQKTNNLNFSKVIGQKTSNYSEGNILPNVTDKIKQNPRQQYAQKITLKRSFWKRKASLSNKVGVLKNLQVSWISLYPFVEPEKKYLQFQSYFPITSFIFRNTLKKLKYGTLDLRINEFLTQIQKLPYTQKPPSPCRNLS